VAGESGGFCAPHARGDVFAAEWSKRSGYLELIPGQAFVVLFFIPQTHGGMSTFPPATPRKSVLIYVTFGDLLKASQIKDEKKRRSITGI
jgi:hypothetical protein